MLLKLCNFTGIFGLVDEQEVWDKLPDSGRNVSSSLFYPGRKVSHAIKGETWSRVYDLTGQVVRRGNPAKKAANDTSKASWQ